MKQWIVREGGTPKAGRYLWDAAPSAFDWTLGGAGIGTVGGGVWRNPATIYTPWWEPGQSGSMLFTDRREAIRMAKRLNGRAVALKRSTDG